MIDITSKHINNIARPNHTISLR